MVELPLSDIIPYLLLAARWTLLLSVIAFAGGGIGALLLLWWRYGAPRWGSRVMTLYVQLLQGTPLLLQLFLVFFGLPLLGIDVSPLLAASIALTLYATARSWRRSGVAVSMPFPAANGTEAPALASTSWRRCAT